MRNSYIMISTRAFTTCLVFIFCLSIHLNAQQILNSIQESGELKVGVSGNQPPYSMEAIDGTLIGFDIDLAQMIANAANLISTLDIPKDDLAVI